MTAVASSPSIAPLTQRAAWDALQVHYRDVKDAHLRDLQRCRELRRAP